MTTIQIDGEHLSFGDLYKIVHEHAVVEISAAARERMTASRKVIERLIASDAAVYGVNTGFGKMASVRISREQIGELQVNLVRSHACGVGAPLNEPETRAMLALRANAIAKGFSGVRPVVAETLCEMLNKSVLPVIPSQGSVGASGDLAPLAHLAQVAIGEGEAIFQGRRIAGGEAMKAAAITPLALEAKEGLALLNGTQAMLALLSLALREAEIAVNTADVAAALSLDALRGSPAAFDERIAKVRPYAGHATTARNLRKLNRGSEIRESHRGADKDTRVQDAYSLRCTPQVHGAVRDALADVRATLEVELNSATDNPLVFAGDGAGAAGEVISGGNFHGQPLAMAADQLAVALATLAGISERRVEQMTNPQTSLLPAFLVKDAGLNSGFMILQVAAAALASEMKTQATPHSVDSIPTSANQEDYVSMGMGGARRIGPMLTNLRNVLAIELLSAAQGIDLLAPLRTGPEAHKAYESVRAVSRMVEADRSLAPDIAKVEREIAHNAFGRLLD
ncbi:MAG TPA: histidine ammonia-lyase [Candidatus Acidoferrales bacterium]